MNVANLRLLVASSIPLLCVFITSCAAITYTSQSVDSPYKPLERVGVRANGQPGRAYSDRSTKKVSLGVTTVGLSGTTVWLGQHQTDIAASSLDWKISWIDGDVVEVDFFDYGAHSKYDSKVTSGEIKRGPTLMKVRLIRAVGSSDFKLNDCAKVACG